MPEDDALAYAVQQALSAVVSTTGLSWTIKNRLFRQMARAIRSHNCPSTSGDFLAWAEVEMADLLANEDIFPLCRLALAEWFAQEVWHWLSGNFDDAA